jgi:hypothetical protein
MEGRGGRSVDREVYCKPPQNFFRAARESSVIELKTASKFFGPAPRVISSNSAQLQLFELFARFPHCFGFVRKNTARTGEI